MKVLPKELRIIVYNVLDSQIINSKQKQIYPDRFQVEPTLVRSIRRQCLDEMDNTNNLWSFVYVHLNGEIETEINVISPKYELHPEYNLSKTPVAI